MGDTGFEHTALTPSKTAISESGGAKSDARDAQNSFFEPDLEAIVIHWAKFPEHIKVAIKALVQTCVK